MTVDADRLVTASSEIDPGLELGRGTYQPVAALFADWAGRDPEMVALRWSGRDYSYGLMWQWVADLADIVRSGQRVAVYGQRSPGTVAALWAVLSAGGVVVPLDDSLPLHRRRIMLEESGAELVIVAGSLDVDWVTRGEVVRISDLEPPSMVTGRAPKPTQSGGGYIFFTSGTTGTPRGIAGSAASLDQFISWMAETFEIGPGDRVAQTRSLSFDASLREVFLPWATGATMCIAPDPLDPERALSWIQEEGITVFNATPTHAEIWLSACNEPAASVLRWVMFSGEMLDEALVDKWRNLVSPPGSIVNLYGPTETTMVRTYWIVPDDLEPGVQPVGFPIPHSQALVVDGTRLCRVGERGEVLLRTSYGTDGYINDPVGQARSFVTNPLTGDMTDVVYRTGDLGWYRDDGALVVSGRIDDQVQILGVRIEPDEVTAHLSAHPNVVSAVVVAERELDPIALTAYLVPSTPAPSAADLRKYLADRVSGPAVPTRFEFLSEMPLTSNGKVDRARLTTATRLSTPGNATSRLGALSPAKRRLLEKRLADRAASQAADRPVPAGSAPEVLAGIPLSSAQERLWFLDRLFPGRSNYNIPRVYRLRGPLDLSALQAAFDSIHARHEILRTTYRELDGVPYQWINAAGPAPVSVVDLTEMEVEQQLAAVARLSDDAGRSSFDLAVGPIWHITVAVLSPLEHVLIMVVHHIAADGWSMPVLFDELRTFYRNRSTGQRDEMLPALTKQYGDYAREQRAHIAAGGYEEDLAYWERQLGGIPTLMPLPVDRPPPSPRDSSGEAHKFIAPNARVEYLENLVRSHRVTPFMVGLALFAGFLSRVTGSDDPVVGVPSADRPSTDLEGLIGFFVNSLPMRPGVPEGTTFRQLLDRVRETAIGAYNHREAPFEHIVNRLQPARSADRSPIFQVFFQFGNAFQGQLELEGIEIEPVLRVRTTTKFDITLYLNISDGALAGRMVYASDIFDLASIDALCQGFAEFAAAALADPDELLTALSVGEAPTVKGSRPSSALPRSVTRLPATDQGALSASTATIERMCEIWESLLGGTAVSPDDDFFARGGHSLLAVRIFSRIEREWGVELPLGALFDAATPRLLSALVDGARGAVATSVVPQRGLERAPLSFAQRRLWFLDLLAPGSSAYHIPWRVGLQGDLNEETLKAAFNTLLIRHAVLRTRIVADQGIPWQVVDPPVPVPIERYDLRDLEPAAATDRLTELITDHGRRPFDLAADLMIRVMLVRIADHRHVLSVVCHHVATDADSMRILRRELRAIYSSHLQGSEPDLPILPLEYADVAAWQVERFSEGEPGLAYWQARLAGELPVLDLVTDRIRPSEFTYSGGAVTVRVPDHVTQRLLGLAGEHAATPVMSLLSAFAVLLYRHTLQEDLIVGIPLTERVLPGTENMVGFLVNSLPIRIEISPTGGFTELLDQVRRRVIEALDHGQVPFEAIVERVDPPRDPGRTPIYQAMFDLTHGGSDRWSLDGLESVPVGVRTTRRIAKFDLRLHCTLRGGQLSATFEYRADLFLPPTVSAMAGQFLRLLESIADHPAEPIDRLDMVPAEDRAEITADEAVPVEHRLGGASISDVFESVVARHPLAVAVESPTGRHTYREVAAMVEELALRLEATGVRPGDAVGIVLPRSLGVAVAMLAVLRTGASYVPLDPAFPTERIRTVCSDGNVTVLIEDGGAQGEVSVTRVEERRPLSEEMHHRVAYTMYTSGSTGAPKGVMVPHEAITRLVCNPNYVTIDVGDGVAFASNVAFDAATFEVFGALLNGARLVIIEPDTLLSPPALASVLADRAVTTMFITTALFNAVIAEKPDAFRSLRELLFGGEQVDASIVRRCLLAGPPQRLVHVYGPTEATTFAAFHVVESIPEAARTVPIGRPVAGTGLRVVDRHMHRVPAGAPGELLISGEGLAIGYLGDPDLTSARFVTIEGLRFYRTGDLVRKRPDGDIEFLGRLDRQMKLRGFRIEPAEIEARLVEHPSVADAVVVARSDQGQARLAAYVVRRSPESPVEEELRDHLRRTLPGFMVPDAITWIDRVPLNSNGKVDPSALPSPEWLFDSAISETDQAGGPDEERMSRVWRSALGRARVGPHDNFFSLGGHSLLAVKLFAEIEREYGVAMPLATLFQAPTVAALTRRVLSDVVEQEPSRDLVAIQPHGDRIPLFCVHSAGGTALEYRALAGHLGTNQPLFSLQAVGMEDNRPPHRTIEEMAGHYEEIVRRQYPSGPYLLAGWSSGGVVAYEMARRLTAAGAKVELLALFDSGFPADPPLRGPRKYWRTIRHPGRSAWRRLWIDIRHVLGNVRHGLPTVLGAWRRRPPSAQHRGWRFWRIAKMAIGSYTPLPYPGSIAFFRARDGGGSQSLAPEKWRTLAATVDLFDVDGTHNGVTCLIREPQVASLATPLRRLLDEINSSGRYE